MASSLGSVASATSATILAADAAAVQPPGGRASFYNAGVNELTKLAFTNWINYRLGDSIIGAAASNDQLQSQRPAVVTDLFQDLKSGQVLLRLLETVSGQPIIIPIESIQAADDLHYPSMLVDHLRVCRALQFIQEEWGAPIDGLGVDAITQGDAQVTLRLVWTIIISSEPALMAFRYGCTGDIPFIAAGAYFHSGSQLGTDLATLRRLAGKSVEQRTEIIKQELLGWLAANSARLGLDDNQLSVNDFSANLQNGMLFFALLRSAMPSLIPQSNWNDLINYSKEKSKRERICRRAFSTAQEKLGVPALLDSRLVAAASAGDNDNTINGLSDPHPLILYVAMLIFGSRRHVINFDLVVVDLRVEIDKCQKEIDVLAREVLTLDSAQQILPGDGKQFLKQKTGSSLANPNQNPVMQYLVQLEKRIDTLLASLTRETMVTNFIVRRHFEQAPMPNPTRRREVLAIIDKYQSDMGAMAQKLTQFRQGVWSQLRIARFALEALKIAFRGRDELTQLRPRVESIKKNSLHFEDCLADLQTVEYDIQSLAGMSKKSPTPQTEERCRLLAQVLKQAFEEVVFATEDVKRKLQPKSFTFAQLKDDLNDMLGVIEDKAKVVNIFLIPNNVQEFMRSNRYTFEMEDSIDNLNSYLMSFGRELNGLEPQISKLRARSSRFLNGSESHGQPATNDPEFIMEVNVLQKNVDDRWAVIRRLLNEKRVALEQLKYAISFLAQLETFKDGLLAMRDAVETMPVDVGEEQELTFVRTASQNIDMSAEDIEMLSGKFKSLISAWPALQSYPDNALPIATQIQESIDRRRELIKQYRMLVKLVTLQQSLSNDLEQLRMDINDLELPEDCAPTASVAREEILAAFTTDLEILRDRFKQLTNFSSYFNVDEPSAVPADTANLINALRERLQISQQGLSEALVAKTQQLDRLNEAVQSSAQFSAIMQRIQAAAGRLIEFPAGSLLTSIPEIPSGLLEIKTLIDHWAAKYSSSDERMRHLLEKRYRSLSLLIDLRKELEIIVRESNEFHNTMLSDYQQAKVEQLREQFEVLFELTDGSKNRLLRLAASTDVINVQPDIIKIGKTNVQHNGFEDVKFCFRQRIVHLQTLIDLRAKVYLASGTFSHFEQINQFISLRFTGLDLSYFLGADNKTAEELAEDFESCSRKVALLQSLIPLLDIRKSNYDDTNDEIRETEKELYSILSKIDQSAKISEEILAAVKVFLSVAEERRKSFNELLLLVKDLYRLEEIFRTSELQEAERLLSDITQRKNRWSERFYSCTEACKTHELKGDRLSSERIHSQFAAIEESLSRYTRMLQSKQEELGRQSQLLSCRDELNSIESGLDPIRQTVAGFNAQEFVSIYARDKIIFTHEYDQTRKLEDQLESLQLKKPFMQEPALKEIIERISNIIQELIAVIEKNRIEFFNQHLLAEFRKQYRTFLDLFENQEKIILQLSVSKDQLLTTGNTGEWEKARDGIAEVSEKLIVLNTKLADLETLFKETCERFRESSDSDRLDEINSRWQDMSSKMIGMQEETKSLRQFFDYARDTKDVLSQGHKLLQEIGEFKQQANFDRIIKFENCQFMVDHSLVSLIGYRVPVFLRRISEWLASYEAYASKPGSQPNLSINIGDEMREQTLWLTECLDDMSGLIDSFGHFQHLESVVSDAASTFAKKMENYSELATTQAWNNLNSAITETLDKIAQFESGHLKFLDFCKDYRVAFQLAMQAVAVLQVSRDGLDLLLHQIFSAKTEVMERVKLADTAAKLDWGSFDSLYADLEKRYLEWSASPAFIYPGFAVPLEYEGYAASLVSKSILAHLKSSLNGHINDFKRLAASISSASAQLVPSIVKAAEDLTKHINTRMSEFMSKDNVSSLISFKKNCQAELNDLEHEENEWRQRCSELLKEVPDFRLVKDAIDSYSKNIGQFKLVLGNMDKVISIHGRAVEISDHLRCSCELAEKNCRDTIDKAVISTEISKLRANFTLFETDRKLWVAALYTEKLDKISKKSELLSKLKDSNFSTSQYTVLIESLEQLLSVCNEYDALNVRFKSEISAFQNEISRFAAEDASRKKIEPAISVFSNLISKIESDFAKVKSTNETAYPKLINYALTEQFSEVFKQLCQEADQRLKDAFKLVDIKNRKFECETLLDRLDRDFAILLREIEDFNPSLAFASILVQVAQINSSKLQAANSKDNFWLPVFEFAQLFDSMPRYEAQLEIFANNTQKFSNQLRETIDNFSSEVLYEDSTLDKRKRTLLETEQLAKERLLSKDKEFETLQAICRFLQSVAGYRETVQTMALEYLPRQNGSREFLASSRKLKTKISSPNLDQLQDDCRLFASSIELTDYFAQLSKLLTQGHELSNRLQLSKSPSVTEGNLDYKDGKVTITLALEFVRLGWITAQFYQFKIIETRLRRHIDRAENWLDETQASLEQLSATIGTTASTAPDEQNSSVARRNLREIEQSIVGNELFAQLAELARLANEKIQASYRMRPPVTGVESMQLFESLGVEKYPDNLFDLEDFQYEKLSWRISDTLQTSVERFEALKSLLTTVNAKALEWQENSQIDKEMLEIERELGEVLDSLFGLDFNSLTLVPSGLATTDRKPYSHEQFLADMMVLASCESKYRQKLSSPIQLLSSDEMLTKMKSNPYFRTKLQFIKAQESLVIKTMTEKRKDSKHRQEVDALLGELRAFAAEIMRMKSDLMCDDSVEFEDLAVGVRDAPASKLTEWKVAYARILTARRLMLDKVKAQERKLQQMKTKCQLLVAVNRVLGVEINVARLEVSKALSSYTRALSDSERMLLTAVGLIDFQSASLSASGNLLQINSKMDSVEKALNEAFCLPLGAIRSGETGHLMRQYLEKLHAIAETLAGLDSNLQSHQNQLFGSLQIPSHHLKRQYPDVEAVLRSAYSQYLVAVDRRRNLCNRLQSEVREAEFKMISNAVIQWLSDTEGVLNNFTSCDVSTDEEADVIRAVRRQSDAIRPIIEVLPSLDGAVALMEEFAEQSLKRLAVDTNESSEISKAKIAYDSTVQSCISRATLVKHRIISWQRELDESRRILDYIQLGRKIEQLLEDINKGLSQPNTNVFAKRMEKQFQVLDDLQRQIVARNVDLVLNRFVRQHRPNSIPPAYSAFVNPSSPGDLSIDFNCWAVPILPFLDPIVEASRKLSDIIGTSGENVSPQPEEQSSHELNTVAPVEIERQAAEIRGMFEAIECARQRIESILSEKTEACKSVKEWLPPDLYAKRPIPLTESDLINILPANTTTLTAVLDRLREEYGHHREVLTTIEANDIPSYRQLINQFLETEQVAQFNNERLLALKHLNQVELKFTDYRRTVQSLQHAITMTKTRNNLLIIDADGI